MERVFDEQGRFSPTYFDDKTTAREADVVIMAIGQKTNLKFITEADGIKLTPRGLIETDPDTKATSREGVFAGGDVETGPWIAIGAVAAGREAATSIDRFLSGQDLKAGRDLPVRPIPKEEGHWNPVPADIQKKHRALMATMPVEEWIKGFKEINLGYKEEAGRRRSGPLHQLRDLLRVHAVRPGLPGQGGGPRAGTGKTGAGGGRGHPGAGLYGL